MTVTYGFYNSSNHDRVYQAQDFSRIFDGIIRDGVFMNVGKVFAITANGADTTITIDTGRAWFNGTWTNNDAKITITPPPSDLLYPRYDALVLEVDTNARVNQFKFISGTAKTNPTRPSMTNTTTLHQYPFAYILRAANSGSIRQADISIQIGTDSVPYVSGILSVVSMESLLGQWRDELDRFVEDETSDFSTWFRQMENNFSTWFAGQQNLMNQKQTDVDNWIAYEEHDFLDWYARMKEQLSEDAAGNLQSQVDLAFNVARESSNNTVTFNSDGTIDEIGDKGSVHVVFNSDGSIVETFTKDGHSIRKVTTFSGDTIREAVTTL